LQRAPAVRILPPKLPRVEERLPVDEGDEAGEVVVLKIK
jgi:hypothetical protein